MLLAALSIVLAAASPDTLVVPVDEVVVIGTRTSETARRAPAAISVVSREAFANKRGIGLSDALGLVPGVFVQSRSGAQDVRVTIRGFGARGNGERSNVGNMRGIRVMTDGINLTEPDGRTSLDLVDLGATDVIEVTRSNASALYGNASGGVLNLRTRLDFDSPYAELRGNAGSFGFHRETGRAGFVTGEGRGTATFSNSTFDGWRRHSQSSSTSGQVRLTVPLDSGTRLGLLFDGASTFSRFPGPLTQAQVDTDPRQADSAFVARDERRFNRVGRFGLTLGKSVTQNQNLSVSAYVEPKVLQRSERGRFRDFNRYHLGGSATYELRQARSEGLGTRLAAGVDEAFQDGSILFYDLAGGARGTTLVANKREAANSAGGFVEGEVQWNSRWALRTSARYDALWYISEDHIEPQLTADRTFIRWTPKGSLSYRTDRHTVYAALGGGVEAPAFNEIDPPAPFNTSTSLNPLLDPMHSITWELGAKGDLGEVPVGRLRYDAAAYWIGVRNEIIPFDGGAYFLTAGKSHREGIELGLDWLPLEALVIEGAVTYMRSEYDEYENQLGDFAGNRVAGLPEVTGTLEADVRLPAGITAEVSGTHVGRYFADDANTTTVPAYTLLGASLSAAVPMGSNVVRAFVSGSNLTDEHHVASAFINGTGGRFFEPGLPRNFSGGLSVRF